MDILVASVWCFENMIFGGNYDGLIRLIIINAFVSLIEMAISTN